jgi:8-oxo-dGTP diphosphatase
MGARAAEIRNSAKAIIIENDRILVMRGRDKDGDWYLLPGGGQKSNESLEETLIRECQEEIDVHIDVGPLRFIREYFSNNHEFAEQDKDIHQIEFMFICKLKSGSIPRNGSVPDKAQIGVEWLQVKELEKYRLYPQKMRRCFMNIDDKAASVYQGDIN